MTQALSLDALWNSVPPAEQVFHSAHGLDIPEMSRRYLEHAIAPGTPLASAVRLRMHEEIKLNQWLPFTGEEVLCWQRDLIWKATVWMKGLPIWGFDRWVDGEAAMSWKLLGLLPVMSAAGPDIARSAVGRLQGEAVWLPSVFCRSDVVWSASNPSEVQAALTRQGETTNLQLKIKDNGQL